MADVVGGPEEMGFKLTFECVSRVYQSLGWPEGGSSRGQGAAMAKALTTQGTGRNGGLLSHSPARSKWLFHFSNNHTATVLNCSVDYISQGLLVGDKSFLSLSFKEHSDSETSVIFLSRLITLSHRNLKLISFQPRANLLSIEILFHMLISSRFFISYHYFRLGLGCSILNT